MEDIKKLRKFLFDSKYREIILLNKGFYNKLSDADYLKKKFRNLMGYELNLDFPVTFNEKLQWLKIHDRKPIYSKMVDKYEAKKYVSNIIGDEYIIPTLGVWDSPDDIDFSLLPRQFVLKCTHNSGLGICICKNKNELDIKKAKRKLKKGLKQNYYLTGREWPYKNVEPRVIAEEYLEDETGSLVDYKFFCFDGYVDNVMVCLERESGDPKFYFFDQKWNLLRINVRGKEAPEGFSIPKPRCMDEMFKIASILSEGLKFNRVDLYECNGRIYFSELTFFPDSGFDKNILPEADEHLGSLIKL